ncbi:MAG: haloalkane dehalogenase [Ardenticatenaceae bacterium]|nr:haloalkane dehalogenase [Ardenticatenaceae bacterium]MCB8947120.1 haloalkane dehalogenase [Ardenticatenaceae bacterium]
MEIVRTPDERFDNLPDYPFAPNYVEINGLRLHTVDEGAGETILCLHGEPSWSYLYRKMIPPLAAQHRVVAPDLVGFGRSDKYTDPAAYSFQMHRDVLVGFIEALDLRGITAVVQDWGGLLGLTIATQLPERFARLVIMNTGLPTGMFPMPEAFMQWRAAAERFGTKLPVGRIIQGSTVTKLPREVVKAYEAPFPDETYKAGAAVFPLLIPLKPEDPGAAEMSRAQRQLTRWTKPTLVMFSDGDPITRGGDALFRRAIPGAKGQPEITIEGAGHFLQEDKGEEIAGHILAFMGRTAVTR